AIQGTLTEALLKLDAFRRAEGASMGQELRALCGVAAGQIEAIARRAPQVVIDYRDRLQERVRDLLSTLEASVGSADLIREVSIFAERCDITEELTRMRSHLGQFESFLDADASQGRKLDFLSQEMFREVNTIGAKANDVEIAHAVVEMKAAVEKIREILQNVE
ncbi:MAG: endoribonuclease YicC domain-containing protein, partial [Planctomycetaceae bacterium]